MYANSLSSRREIKKKKRNTLCQKCLGAGYKGRNWTYELLLLIEKFKMQFLKEKQIEKLSSSC